METEKRTVGPVSQGAGMGTAVALLIAFLIQHFTGVLLPGEVQAALALVIAYAGALLGGFLVKPGTGKRVDRG